MNAQPVSETDLHAYVDGELGEERHRELAALIEASPEAVERVVAYRAQEAALRRLFDPVLNEPVPAALRTAALGERSAGRSIWPPLRLAASLLLAVAASLGGWFAHERYGPAPSLATALSHRAAVAHAVFTPDVRRPVEIAGDHEDQLVTWVSKRMGTPVRSPRLGPFGYELVGGRLLPGESGPVAQFMYQDASGQRLTLYVTAELAKNRDTAFRFAQEGSLNVFYWIDGKLGYALSGNLPREELGRLASTVYDQLQEK
jgi:anti-sigma factor RsiW